MLAARDMASTSSFRLKPKRGLRNLGNTCYMNSAIQAINTCDGFKQRILQSKKPKDSQRVTIQLRRLFFDLDQANAGPHSPATFARTARPAWFTPGQQQDSSEFLRHLLNEVHEEEHSLVPFDQEISDDKLPKTIVEENFGIGLLNIYECLKCHYELKVEETRLDLVLPLPRGKKTNSVPLEQLISNFQQAERMDGNRKYYCEKCNTDRDTERTATIKKYPKYMIINLARFLYVPETNSQTKNLTPVAYPKVLHLKSENPDSKQKTGPQQSYTLRAIVVHSGPSCNSGHYYCFGSDNSASWYNFNDTSVSSLSKGFSFKEKGATTACVLIYANEKSSVEWSSMVDVPDDLQQYHRAPRKEDEDLQKWRTEVEVTGTMDHGMNQNAQSEKKKDIHEEFTDKQVQRMVKNCKTSEELLKKAEMFAHVEHPIVLERLEVLKAKEIEQQEKIPKEGMKGENSQKPKEQIREVAGQAQKDPTTSASGKPVESKSQTSINESKQSKNPEEDQTLSPSFGHGQKEEAFDNVTKVTDDVSQLSIKEDLGDVLKDGGEVDVKELPSVPDINKVQWDDNATQPKELQHFDVSHPSRQTENAAQSSSNDPKTHHPEGVTTLKSATVNDSQQSQENCDKGTSEVERECTAESHSSTQEAASNELAEVKSSNVHHHNTSEEGGNKNLTMGQQPIVHMKTTSASGPKDRDSSTQGAGGSVVEDATLSKRSDIKRKHPDSETNTSERKKTRDKNGDTTANVYGKTFSDLNYGPESKRQRKNDCCAIL